MTAQLAPPLARRAFAEFLGTGLLVTVVVGSGIAAARLSPDDTGLALLENAVATAAGLAVIILLVGPVSGAHLNPVVSLADAVLGRRRGTGLSGRELGAYLPAQFVGGGVGAVLANVMFDLLAVSVATNDRSAAHLLLGEVVATAGLIALVFALTRNGKTSAAPAAIGAYIGAAYWFTSSTSFANPAVTAARALSDTFTGIAPASVPGFLVAQLVGAALGVGVVRLLYPDVPHAAAPVVIALPIPQTHRRSDHDRTEHRPRRHPRDRPAALRGSGHPFDSRTARRGARRGSGMLWHNVRGVMLRFRARQR